MTIDPLHQGLEELRAKLLEMSGLVEDAIHRSVSAIVELQVDMARRVFDYEGRVNRLELEIDRIAIQLLVRERPTASDLRLITMAIKINNNLERMGDIAVNIAERAVSLNERPGDRPEVDIPLLARLAREMVRDSLDSFVRRDSKLARQVLLSDDAVDRLRDQFYDELVRFMEADSRRIRCGIDYMFVARSLERLADHATNIAEDVLFLLEGVDVRHHLKAEPAE